MAHHSARRVILITGASGKIGLLLRRHFAASDYDLRLLDLSAEKLPNFIRADLREFDPCWADAFAGVDTVIHLAANPDPFADAEAVHGPNVVATSNVFQAVRQHAVRRVIFASSNWVMAGYRFYRGILKADLPPRPIGPYGESKLFGEQAGRRLSEDNDISFIALRIGYLLATGQQPGPRMALGSWGQQMWISQRDLGQGFEKAVEAKDIKFAVLNLMSDNAGMRWDIAHTRREIGYVPQDGHITVRTRKVVLADARARLAMAFGLRPSRYW